MTGITSDVVVIGGGPGGSTAATMLARNGLRVLLLERDWFPRDHVGESLLPASVPVLEELGVRPAVEAAGFLHKWGATMVWGSDTAPWSWYFKETNSRYPHSYQVWRRQFDQLLLENSRSQGVDVREGHRVVEVLFQDGAATGVRYITPEGEIRTTTARFVVDASGQAAVTARALGLRQWDTFFQNLAVYAYFTGAQKLPPPDETNIFIESYSKGWLWAIPLHNGQTSVGAVVDSISGQQGIARAGLERFLRDQIAQAPNCAKMLANARLDAGPYAVKDWSYASEKLVGDGYILVGDAACFVDPLFSSGVHLALTAGVLAAAYVTSALEDASIARAAADVYQELYLKEYNQFRDMARLFYSSNLSVDSYFWEARRLSETEARFTPRQAFIQSVAGQPPRGYERVVLDRGQAPSDFIASVRSVEEERSNRRRDMARLTASNLPDQLSQTVPKLAPGVLLRRQPILGEAKFEWGYVLSRPERPEGIPCSVLVARVVSHIDGKTKLAEILSKLNEGASEAQAAQISQSVGSAMQILYVDGIIDEIRGL